MTGPGQPSVDKRAVLSSIVAALEAELGRQTAAAHASREEATDVDSRAEGKFDMRGQSAAYLAAGQAQLATEIAEAISAYRALPIRDFGPGSAAALGAVVTLEQAGLRTVYFLGPSRGGLEVESGGIAVTVITPSSSLGRSLIGRRAGESVRLPGRSGPAPHRIEALA